MNRVKRIIAITLLLVLSPLQIFAAATDRKQPIQIEADSLEVRDDDNISIYSGNVRLEQGSLLIKADRLVIYFNADKELDLMEMTGRPATYRQLDDDNKEMLGQADKLEYFEPKSLLILTGNACFNSNGDVIESSTISINTENDNLQATSPEPDKRVRVVIQPKDKATIEPAERKIDCK